jgi:hypothetical protein
MNTRLTPPNQSRQASVIPYVYQLPRNGPGNHGPSSSIYTLSQFKSTQRLTKSASTDTLELQTLTNQRLTRDAFNELEQLVLSGGIARRASIVEINEFIHEQDETMIDERSNYCQS